MRGVAHEALKLAKSVMKEGAVKGVRSKKTALDAAKYVRQISGSLAAFEKHSNQKALDSAIAHAKNLKPAVEDLEKQVKALVDYAERLESQVK